ncbi:hypothetical protein CMO91_00465 [Candidatus Woesearchaeota archaeon]|nr:hypothetical protein [Candidatus Woesearchaeota archaeon]
MSLDLGQFRDLVVRPTLKEFGMYSEAAEQLLMGTIAQESRGTYLKQLGNGPALGLFQMEPNTHEDIWLNYLKYRPTTQEELLAQVPSASHDYALMHHVPPHEELVSNLKYATIMCRLHYRRVPKSLPKAGDIEGLARYWKEHYNTALGAGTVEEFCENFPKELYQ